MSMWCMAYGFPCAAFFSMTLSLNEALKSGFFFRRVPSRTLTSSGLAAFAREELARMRQRLLSRRLQAKRRLRTLLFHVMSLTLIPKRALRNAMVTNRDLIGITKRACTLCKCTKCRCCVPMRDRCGSNFGVCHWQRIENPRKLVFGSPRRQRCTSRASAEEPAPP